MKKLFILILFLLLAGCAGTSDYLNKIPQIGFDSFEYHRGGNITSADIVATGAQVENGKLKIKSISISENWGGLLLL